MSSVDSSNKNEDSIRAQREHYIKKESNIVKKHSKEIRRLSEQHHKELESLKKSHSHRIRDIQKKSRDDLFRRDKKNNDEILKLKDFQRKQTRKMAEGADVKYTNLRYATKKDQSLEKSRHQDRLLNINKQYTKDIGNLKRQHEVEIESMRNSQKQSITDSGEKKDRAHSVEIKTLEKNRQEAIHSLQKKIIDQRETSDHRIKTQKLSNFKDKVRMQDNFMDSVQRERETASHTMDRMRDGFSKGQADTRAKYQKSTENQKQQHIKSIHKLEEDVVGRQNTEVRNLKQKVENLKSQNIRGQLDSKWKTKKHDDNLKHAYQNQLEDIRERQVNLVDDFNTKNVKDIKKIRKETSDLLKNTNKYYKSELMMKDDKNREALKNIKDTSEVNKKLKEKNFNKREETLVSRSTNERESMKNYYSATIDDLKENNEIQKRQIVRKINADRSLSEANLRVRAQKTQIDDAKRLDRTILKYKREIEKLNSESIIKRRSEKRKNDSTVRNMKRLHETQLTSVKQQYEEKLTRYKETERGRAQTTETRHRAQIDNLLNVTKKS